MDWTLSPSRLRVGWPLVARQPSFAWRYERRALVRVPAPVLAEVCRGVRQDAAVNRPLAHPGVVVSELTRPVAQRAGHLLARLKLSSAHAVDAFVVATALQFESAVIATGDPADIRRLAAPYRHIGVFAL